MKILKAIWQFCSYLFLPQKRPKDYYDTWFAIQTSAGHSADSKGCALWLLLFLCAGASFSKRNKRICSLLWRKEKEPKKHPPPPSLTSSSSVTTRESRSKLHSLLAAPSVPPILGGCNWLRSETNLRQSSCVLSVASDQRSSVGMTYGAFALRVSHDRLIVKKRKSWRRIRIRRFGGCLRESGWCDGNIHRQG